MLLLLLAMTSASAQLPLREPLNAYVASVVQEFEQIPQVRKDDLARIASYVRERQNQNKPVNLLFVCTHNSRRSQMAQAWAKVAADYHGVANVTTFSGGLEVTAFNQRAVSALQRSGFKITSTPSPLSGGSLYHLEYAEGKQVHNMVSKKFKNAIQPGIPFAAIMVCSDADKKCPYVPGADMRIGVAYDDPKVADGKANEQQVYDERCCQIAREMFYAMSLVKQGQ